MNEHRNKMKKSEKPVIGKSLPGSSTSFNAKQVVLIESDNISMSKQLNGRKLAKARAKKTPSKRKTNKRNSAKGKRSMPTFSDLEKMFDDSEVTDTVDKAQYSDINLNPIQTESKTKEIVTLTQNILSSESNDCNVNNVISVDDRQIPLIKTVLTPSSLIFNNSVKILSSDHIILPKLKDSEEIIVIDDAEQQERKRKKSISRNGDIIENEILDFEHPQKIRRLSESSETCHTIKNNPDGSDSDVTIIYDLEGPPKISPLQSFKRFSPLPSTSTDSVTISKNDKSFMNSLSESKNSTFIEISKDEYQDVIVIDDIHPNYFTQEAQNLENEEERVEEQPHQHSYTDDIDDLIETNYSSSDLIDVDAIIAENECILTKYKTVENLPTIIEVEPRENITQMNTLEINCSTSNNQETLLPFSTQIATNQNISTQSHNSNTRDINHRNSQRTSRSIPVPINTINQNTPRNYTVISPQNTNPVNQITNRETSDVASSLNCPICLENLRSRECASTICGHIFCMVCIKRALKNTRRCPTCRKFVKGQGGYHRLFL